MRHAKSDWGHAAQRDFDRPLAARGESDAPRMGRWMRERGWVPDYVLSSPAQRARDTALKVCAALEWTGDGIQWDPAVYAAGLPRLLEVLGRCPARPNVLLIGHNPGLEELLTYLARGSGTLPKADKLMPTAALAVLALPADWQGLSAGSARVLDWMTPKRLPDE
ncbi:MAG: SixA phosphatase family protein [Gammaproteobacteria bacterium]